LRSRVHCCWRSACFHSVCRSAALIWPSCDHDTRLLSAHPCASPTPKHKAKSALITPAALTRSVSISARICASPSPSCVRPTTRATLSNIALNWSKVTSRCWSSPSSPLASGNSIAKSRLTASAAADIRVRQKSRTAQPPSGTPTRSREGEGAQHIPETKSTTHLRAPALADARGSGRP
jgi:hypothetical protein